VEAVLIADGCVNRKPKSALRWPHNDFGENGCKEIRRASMIFGGRRLRKSGGKKAASASFERMKADLWAIGIRTGCPPLTGCGATILTSRLRVVIDHHASATQE
jgi:hypothetical protein